jgi:hypothetical protein
VFPILFASVLGRAVHAILTWRLEKGERVGILDTLAGSTSLTSTVTSQLQLRRITLLGVALIAVWVLSPIGGQGSIRQITISEVISVQPTSFNYVVPHGNMKLYAEDRSLSVRLILETIFLAAIIGPLSIKSSPLDTWGNVKVPSIEYYEKESEADDEGWYDTRGGSYDSYSSIIGIPMTGTNSSEFIDYRMKIPSMYLHLDCSLVTLQDAYPEFLPNGSRSPSVQSGGSEAWWVDDTKQRVNTALGDLKPFTFSYRTWGTPRIYCSMTTTYVELDIICPTSSTCSAAKIRRSLLDHPPPAWTMMDMGSYGNSTNLDARTNWDLFLDQFLAMGQGTNGHATQLDYYMADPETANRLWGAIKGEVPREAFSVRLNQLINALWFCMNGLRAITGGLSDETSYLNNTNVSFARENFPDLYGGRMAIAWPAVGTKSTKKSVIAAHKGWVAALAVASTTLILSSLVPPIVRWSLTKGPDLMMNISSLATRDNPYIPLPANGTFMDASDRSRLLKDLKLRFGDVGGRAEAAGRLAIGSLDGPGGSSVARVRKGYVYE